MFDEMLDEVFGKVNICGYEYLASYALQELDPVAYREEFNNWLDQYEWSEDEEDPNHYVKAKGD
jgi:hypothetical protein